MSKLIKTAIIAGALYANHKANFKVGQVLVLRGLVLNAFK